MLVLRDYQESNMSEIRAEFKQHKRVLFVSPTGSGKCLGYDTPILMFSGKIKKVQDIKVGDILIGPDSLPRIVKSTCIGQSMLYKVIPRKGSPYIVNEDHILSLRMSNTQARSCGKVGIVNISVKNYLSENKTFKNFAKGWRSSVNFPVFWESLKIDPYFLGIWLGDGQSKGNCICSGDFEIVNFLNEYADELGMNIRIDNNSENSKNYFFLEKSGGRGPNHNRLTNALHSYHLIKNKHIPHRYKTGSREERLKVLAGILDTDGYFSNGTFDLVLKSEVLMDDVIFVARSLGFACYKKAVKKTCVSNGKVGSYFRISISGDLSQIPVRIKRKIAWERKQIKNPLNVGISVEQMGWGDYYGFELDGPDGLFLLGDFTVTHNTVIFTYIAQNAQKKGNVLILAHRQEIVDQISKALSKFGVNHGLILAGTKMTYDDVQVGMVQTVARRLSKIHPPKLIIIDEAHHAVAGTWFKITNEFKDARILGVTATPQRRDGKGLKAAFDVMVIGLSVKKLIEMEFLSGFDLYAPPTAIDLSEVRTEMGDYKIDEIERIMDKASITGSATAHYKKYLNGAPAIVFCTTLKHSQHVCEQFRVEGWMADSIDGKMTKEERRDRVTRLGNGQLNVLTSCEIVSEGFDLPVVQGAILLRPTKSLAVYLQQVGRCLRPKPNGSRAVILDHVGVVHNLGMPDEPRAWTLEGKLKGPKKSPTQCKRCYKVFYSKPPCEDSECPIGKPGVGRDSPKEVDGELQAMVDPYEWAKGIDIAFAKGEEWRSLLAHAEGKLDRLRQIQKIRGYKQGWIARMMGDHSADTAWWRKK